VRRKGNQESIWWTAHKGEHGLGAVLLFFWRRRKQLWRSDGEGKLRGKDRLHAGVVDQGWDVYIFKKCARMRKGLAWLSCLGGRTKRLVPDAITFIARENGGDMVEE